MRRSSLPLLLGLAVLLLIVLAFFFTDSETTESGQGKIAESSPTPSVTDKSNLFGTQLPKGVRDLQQTEPVPAARVIASQLRRGENNRYLFETAVEVEREVELGTISPERLLSVRPGEPVGPLTLDEHTLSAVESHLDPAAVKRFINSSDQALVLPLNHQHEVVFDVQKVITRGEHTQTLLGSARDNSFGDILLVVHDGAVSGTVAFLDRNSHFQYAMVGNGDVAIRELDTDSYPALCGEPDDRLKKGESFEEESIAQIDKIPPAGTTIIDGVVGYGVAARLAQGSTAAIEALILASADRTNLAFTNSNASRAFFSLMASVEDPSYNFPGNFPDSMSDELQGLDLHGDGILDTISQLRIDLGADQQSMVIRQVDGAAGLAYRPGISQISARDYMTSTRLVFPHELGHNIGCLHSWGDTSRDVETGYAYGWRLKPVGAAGVRTIMAYDWRWGNGVVIPYFANPAVTYNGAKTGAENGANVAGDPSADQRYVSGGLSGFGGRGFDGSNGRLGARNAVYIEQLRSAIANRARRRAIAVLEPTGSHRFDRGNTETIFWHGGDQTDTVRLELYKGGIFQQVIATDVPAHERYYDWDIPTVPNGGDYTVKVTLNNNESSFSNNFEMFSRENDEDGDGLPDPSESNTGVFLSISDTGTDPARADSDGDGFSDALEVAVGTDPNRSSYFPENGGFVLLEDFESRLFTLDDNARGIRNWSSPDKADGLVVEIDPDNPKNRAGAINGKGSAIDIFLNIPNLVTEFSSATLYFEIRLQGNDNTAVGLSAKSNPFTWTHFESYLQLKDGTYLNDAGTERLVGEALENDRWVRIWMQVDNDLDTYEVYRQDFPSDEEASPPLVKLETAESLSQFGFRNGTEFDLQSFAIRTSSGLAVGEQLHIDNIYLNPTEASLTNPTLENKPRFTLIEDFEDPAFSMGQSVDQIRSWSAEYDPEALTVTADPDQPGNRAGALNGVNRLTDVFLRLPLSIPNRDVGTLFFELRPSHEGTLSIGLTDETLPFLRASYESEIYIDESFKIWNNSVNLPSDLEPTENEWVKVWMVAQNDIDHYQVYTQAAGESEPSLLSVAGLGSDFPLRNGTNNVLRTLLIQPGQTLNTGESFYLDNVYLDPKTKNLTDPTLIPDFPIVGEIAFVDETIELSVSNLKADQRYLLERSESLDGTWTTIAEDFIPSSSTHLFVDEEPALKQVFYRFQVEFLRD